MSHNTVSGYLAALNQDIVSLSGAAVVDGVIPQTPNGAPTRLVIPTYNEANAFGSSLRGQRFRGTSGTPSAIQSGDVMLQIAADGYNGNDLASGRVSIALLAAGNWSDTSNPTYVRIRTTPVGETGALSRVYVGENGNVGIGTDTPDYRLEVNGIGNFVSGLLVGGVPVSTGASVNAETVAATGAQSVAYTNQVSGALQGLINEASSDVSSLNGQSGTLVIAGTGGITILSGGAGLLLVSGDQSISGALTQTGQILRALTLGGDTNLSGAVGATGQVLQGRVNSLSGFVGQVSGGLETRIAQSGSASVAFTAGGDSNLSGALTATGQRVFQLASGVSGNLSQTGATLAQMIANSGQQAYLYAAAGDSIISGNVTQSGAVLDGRISSLSGFVGGVSGALQAQISAGNGTQVKITGSSTVSIADFTGIDGITVFWSGGQIFVSGAAGAAGGVTSINSLVGGVSIVGTGGLTVSINGQSILVSGDSSISGALTQSGVAIIAKIDSLSGYSASAVNLTLTGQTLQGRIDSLSGFVGGVSGGLETRIAQTGNAAIVQANSIGNALSGNLTTTGQQVYNLIVGGDTNLSGNMTQTGVVLQGRVVSLSGFVGNVSGGLEVRIAQSGSAAVVHANGVGIILSGNLTQTGVALIARDALISGWLSSGIAQTGSDLSTKVASLSGFTIGVSGALQSLIAGGGSVVTVSGSSPIAVADFTGIGGIQVVYSGSRVFVSGAAGAPGGGVSSINGLTDAVVLSGTTGCEISISGGNLTIGVAFESGESLKLGGPTLFTTGIANKPTLTYFDTGWGPTFVGPALWNKQFVCIMPAATTSQTVLGDTLANVGTIGTIASEILGGISTITPAAGLSAGTSNTTADIYRGSTNGRNGFFFVSKFALTTAWGTSGLATSSYAAPSGCRVFVGLTTQAIATQVGLNEPAGDYIGLNYLWASGGAVGTGQYMQNWAIRSRDNVATTTGTLPMAFQTGLYRFTMYCKPFPDNNTVWYQLDDMLRGSGCAGTITSNLPRGNQPMRTMTALGFVSGIKIIGSNVQYCETLGSPLE